jgi:hypothetical protein
MAREAIQLETNRQLRQNNRKKKKGCRAWSTDSTCRQGDKSTYH